MKTILLVLALSLATVTGRADDSEGTLLKVGDAVPSFTATSTANERISTEGQVGKVMLVNFFATWCPPCMEEMPQLETAVWQKFKDRGLVLVAFGREHSMEEMVKFKADRHFTFPIAADPKKEIYSKFATKFIPRNFLVGRDGKIIFISVGYRQAEFENLLSLIDKELGKPGS